MLLLLSLTQLFHLHGLPATIISDRDPRFLSTFWCTLMEKHMGTTLKFSMAFHP